MVNIVLPDNDPNSVFVFGSNLGGLHKGGAAKFAHENYGAEWGVGVGLTGRCYAIPTLGHNMGQLPLTAINYYVAQFLDKAQSCPVLSRFKFYVTPIGCGIAGFRPYDIAPMFRYAPSNVILPEEFK